MRKLSTPFYLLPLLTLLTACGEDVSGGEIIAGGLGIYAVLSIIAFAIVVWAIIDLIRQPYPMSKKLIWGAVIFFIPFIGALLYFFLGRGGNRVVS